MQSELDVKKKEIFEKYEFVEPFDCTTIEQLNLLEEILKDVKICMPEFTPRDVKHYNDDAKAYKKHLLEAWKIHKKYNNAPDKAVTELMDQLIWLGIPKPMTKKEARKVFVKELAYDRLREVNTPKRIANKLANQIADYKEKHNLIK